MSDAAQAFEQLRAEVTVMRRAVEELRSAIEAVPTVDYAPTLERWCSGAAEFLETANFAAGQGFNNKSAFLLHQAAEQLYVCILLTLTLYSPKSHKLNFLRSQAERLAPELIAAWPRETREDRRRFELLRRAYVEARYSPAYVIGADDLAWLAARIKDLQASVNQVCSRRLNAGHALTS